MVRLGLNTVTIHECKGHSHKVNSVGWNCTGSRLASASLDKTVKIWSVEGSAQGREITSLVGHESGVERVRWHPTDPHVICTAAADRKILLWDVRSPSNNASNISSNPFKIAEINLVNKKNISPSSIEWHPDGIALTVAERDNFVYVYDLRKSLKVNIPTLRTTVIGEPIIRQNLRPSVVAECHFSPVGNHLIATLRAPNGMGNIKIWDCNIDKKQHHPATSSSFIGHTGPIYCLDYSPCRTRLATGGADALVGLWNLQEMTCSSTVGRLHQFIRSVSFSHDSKLLASCSAERYIDIANADTGEKVGHIETKFGAVEIAFNPKSYALAYASDVPHDIYSRDKDRLSFVNVAKLSLKDN